MAHTFYTSRKDQNSITGAYGQGACNYCGQISSQPGNDDELTVHLTNVVGTITILDAIEIARYCRDQLRPAWYAGQPGWAEILIQGRVWADALFLDRGIAVWGLAAGEVAEIERRGYHNPWLYDKEQELTGISRVIRAEDEDGREWQALKRPGAPLANLDWVPV